MKRQALVLIITLAALLGLATSVAAQDETVTESFAVLAIDSEATSGLATLASSEPNFDPSSIAVSVDGVEATTGSAAELEAVNEVTFIVDLNTRAGEEYLEQVKSSLNSAIGDLAPETRVRLVTAGEYSQIASDSNGSIEAALREINRLELDAATSLNKSVATAANLFSVSDSTRSIILISTGPETSQEAPVPDSTLVASGAQLFVVQAGSSIGSDVPGLVDQSGGVVVEAGDDLRSAVTQITQASQKRWTVEFSFAEGSSGRVPATFGNQELSFHVGSLNSGSANLLPLVAGESNGTPGFFGNRIVFFVSLFLAVGLISSGVFYFVNMVAQQRENAIDGVLSSYISDAKAPTESLSQADQLIQSAIVKRAITVAESLAERRGFTERVNQQLERADLPLRAGEVLVALSGGAVLLSVLVYAVSRSIIGSVLVLLAILTAGFFSLQMMGTRRLRKFELQLPDTLQLLAGTLRAGYSLPQGLDAVAKEMPDPIGSELAKAMSDASLGRDLEESLNDVGEKMDSPDFAWTVLALGIQREVGGNLNELLTTVADTITQRERLRGEVKALTAEGRVSAGILTMMPPSIMMIIFVMNPDYIKPLFTTVVGLILLGLGIFAGVVGLLWMKKVITIDA